MDTLRFNVPYYIWYVGLLYWYVYCGLYIFKLDNMGYKPCNAKCPGKENPCTVGGSWAFFLFLTN